MQTPTAAQYFAALQDILRIQQDVLTKTLPHSGERGSNTEEYIREFLRRTLPRRFSVGTGFLICSTPGVPVSAQTDIVVYDELNNTPLFREVAASVFPVEIVYAAVEVKTTLDLKELKKCVKAIAGIRLLGKEKRYVEFGKKKLPGRKKSVLVLKERRDFMPPRTFVVAYDTDYSNPNTLLNAWARELSKAPKTHLHGCLVLKKEWYFTQFAHRQPAQLQVDHGHGLVRFLSGLLTGVTSMNITNANLNRYFAITQTFSPPSPATPPSPMSPPSKVTPPIRRAHATPLVKRRRR